MRDKFTEWLIHSRHVAGLTQEEAALLMERLWKGEEEP